LGSWQEFEGPLLANGGCNSRLGQAYAIFLVDEVRQALSPNNFFSFIDI
jgi:hypothetical protein